MKTLTDFGYINPLDDLHKQRTKYIIDVINNGKIKRYNRLNQKQTN